MSGWATQRELRALRGEWRRALCQHGRNLRAGYVILAEDTRVLLAELESRMEGIARGR